MPKVGGNDIDECMHICVNDEQTKREYPDPEKRRKVCYAAYRNHVNDKIIDRIYSNEK